MDKKEKIQLEISKTLDQFNQAEALPPNPWFHTRVMSRLEDHQGKKGVYGSILKPALLTALVALNLGTGIWYFSSSYQTDPANSQNQLIEILSGDLNANSNQSTFFDND